MVIETHDLLKISHDDIISHSPIPQWAVQSLKKAPYVVVRRVHAPKGQVAIGIRGKARNERCGAFLPVDCVLKQIKPEHLKERNLWKKKLSPVFLAMEFAEAILEGYGLSWGPGGSAGFELASGVETVTSKSDLDIIIRAPKPLPANKALEITKEFKNCPVRVDLQVETTEGGFSLLEYARGTGTVLLKTMFGPKLSSNPWAETKIF
ncbi:malonate decarboxylase holo-ACP synthase [Neobacillus cucumis]|uniref:malonate decarboxylase holo-ACP synthase n=1 Tax=Neobacillus cucumis TaxID=1740721 RepID=UPI0018DF3B48|nr:malonate decarboxylase holo-ACP synthase [Neobacillus cucumis]MBI0576808.1 malonate decarboxylase holo-ACP synthase [Neobacillus cucumis]